MLAVQRGDELVWAGNCGTGFSEAEIERLLGKLRPLVRKTSPLAVVPKMPRVRSDDVVWVSPKLVAQVEFSEWTATAACERPRTRVCETIKNLQTCTGSSQSRRRSSEGRAFFG